MATAGRHGHRPGFLRSARSAYQAARDQSSGASDAGSPGYSRGPASVGKWIGPAWPASIHAMPR